MMSRKSPDIFSCCESNQLAGMRRLLKGGADPNQEQLRRVGLIGFAGPRRQAFMSLLQVAAMRGLTEMAECLLEFGANPEKRAGGVEGETALHLATNAGHLGVVRCLIKAGADVSATKDKGITPLCSAARWGRSLAIIQCLVEAGSEFKDCNPSPLALAAKCGHIDIVRYLIEAGAIKDKKQCPDFKGPPALIAAAEGGQAEVILKILK